MKEIILINGGVTLVDDADYEALNQYRWAKMKVKHRYYVKRSISCGHRGTGKTILMHREIMTPEVWQQVDHRDRDGLNNQRSNLRLCNQTQNNGNQRLRRDNTSGFRGVNWHKLMKKWTAEIRPAGKKKVLGYFDNPKDACVAYDIAAKQLYGEFYNVQSSI